MPRLDAEFVTDNLYQHYLDRLEGNGDEIAAELGHRINKDLVVQRGEIFYDSRLDMIVIDDTFWNTLEQWQRDELSKFGLEGQSND